MEDSNQIATKVYDLLGSVIDPELGRSVTELNMVTGVSVSEAQCDTSSCKNLQPDYDNTYEPNHETDYEPNYKPTYNVDINLELTVPNCPLAEVITERVKEAVSKYPKIKLIPHITTAAMSEDKLAKLVSDLKAERKENPFNKSGNHTRVFAIASGKGGVGKSSITANLAATFAALGYDTAAIDADVYGFSLPRMFGVNSQPTNLNGMLMPVVAWGVKLISIGMFAGTDRAILWRGPRLQRSLEQFLSDVWWGNPDILLLDLAPGTGDMALAVAQSLPNVEIIVVTTPQPSASDVAVRAGLMALQIPVSVTGVVENMSWFENNGERLEIFGSGGGKRVSEQLCKALDKNIPLLAQIPLDTSIRELCESGRPAVLTEKGELADTELANTFVKLANSLMKDSTRN
ncbi:Mrp/NBP35 family ATP-binding protein [Gardnerella vaginalis]|uniref:Iron-sulfur cluster carrier protein n=1 Tax=Gardnerella vaginalis TaxID=2702 RepID=A0A2K1SWH9_GARVA|nr:Mrp/NBP35 family ATP-binding protein [Gardnerella vaginalis]PNS43865.1 MRP family ATP-binding protein [Gardnerella vaginalis]